MAVDHSCYLMVREALFMTNAVSRIICNFPRHDDSKIYCVFRYHLLFDCHLVLLMDLTATYYFILSTGFLSLSFSFSSPSSSSSSSSFPRHQLTDNPQPIHIRVLLIYSFGFQHTRPHLELFNTTSRTT